MGSGVEGGGRVVLQGGRTSAASRASMSDSSPSDSSQRGPGRVGHPPQNCLRSTRRCERTIPASCPSRSPSRAAVGTPPLAPSYNREAQPWPQLQPHPQRTSPSMPCPAATGGLKAGSPRRIVSSPTAAQGQQARAQGESPGPGSSGAVSVREQALPAGVHRALTWPHPIGWRCKRAGARAGQACRWPGSHAGRAGG